MDEELGVKRDENWSLKTRVNKVRRKRWTRSTRSLKWEEHRKNESDEVNEIEQVLKMWRVDEEWDWRVQRNQRDLEKKGRKDKSVKQDKTWGSKLACWRDVRGYHRSRSEWGVTELPPTLRIPARSKNGVTDRKDFDVLLSDRSLAISSWKCWRCTRRIQSASVSNISETWIQRDERKAWLWRQILAMKRRT